MNKFISASLEVLEQTVNILSYNDNLRAHVIAKSTLRLEDTFELF